jgi:hypothetical protein
MLDKMDSVTAWVARAPDGTTPSSELAITTDHDTAGWGSDGVSAMISAGDQASEHRLEQELAATDLTDFTELRMSVNIATPRSGFLLEIRLASSNMGFDDALNTWHRLIPAGPQRGWMVVTVGLDDLPAGVGRAVTGIRLRCLAGSFRIHLDDVVAVRPEPLADTDAALLGLLDGVEIGGTSITSAIRVPAQPIPAAPAIDIEQFDIRYAGDRVLDTPLPGDFTVNGYRECRAGAPFDLDYAVRPVAADRASQAGLFEAVLTRVPGNGEMVINGERATVRLVSVAGTDRIGGVVGNDPTLVYRIGVRSPAVRGPRVVRVDRIAIGGDLRNAS